MALKLTLIRLHTSSKLDSIQGELYVDGLFFCHTIERLSTSIPRGCYPLAVTYSPKFHRLLPLLTVKGRFGIRIHSGNTSSDSQGCILVGKLDSDFTVSNSRVILKLLLELLQNKLHGKVSQIIIK